MCALDRLSPARRARLPAPGAALGRRHPNGPKYPRRPIGREAGVFPFPAHAGWPKLLRVEFFCYHRDRPGSGPLRDRLIEAHWSYMDGFERELIARGPTLTPDGEEATGSVHVVELPDTTAARAFAFDEPNYQAGVYRDVLIRRWENRLGRTMWQFSGGRSGGRRFLVLGLGEGPAVDDQPPGDVEELIAYGPLLSDDGQAWLGTAALIRAADEDAARTLFTVEHYASVEVHPFEFGGRR